jgi:pimeloyl-ACP methyl ester carboxylesterase
MLEPYDPARIPVLMVHGLRSSPHIWQSLTDLLFGDPQLSGAYQVWHYFYPTGAPYLYAALELRRRLDALYASLTEESGRAPAKLVLIGHSMGGILARALTVNSDWQLWDAAFAIRPDELVMPQAQRQELEHILRLEALPYVSRVVLLATPNRGSDAARGWAAAIARRLLALPVTLRLVFGPLQRTPLRQIRDELRATFRRGGPSSLDALSPGYPVLSALALLPSTVPFHQIIGVVEKQPGSKGSDGVVTFESSLLPDAASTLIVPRHHSDFGAPEVLAEIRRILLLHALSAI